MKALNSNKNGSESVKAFLDYGGVSALEKDRLQLERYEI